MHVTSREEAAGLLSPVAFRGDDVTTPTWKLSLDCFLQSFQATYSYYCIDNICKSLAAKRPPHPSDTGGGGAGRTPVRGPCPPLLSIHCRFEPNWRKTQSHVTSVYTRCQGAQFRVFLLLEGNMLCHHEFENSLNPLPLCQWRRFWRPQHVFPKRQTCPKKICCTYT